MANRYVAWRVGVGIVMAVGMLLFALLWNPTECMSPAVACPYPGGPACVVPVYCSHRYAPFRVWVAIAGLVVGIALTWSARAERRLASP
jgi:hypothetical protein